MGNMRTFILMAAMTALLMGLGWLLGGQGGAIMALADNLGGTATMINLPPGKTTTTIESKTNFLRPIRIGDTATARAVPLHKGRTTMVWQTTITRPDGKPAAVVTQTQLTIDWKA